MTQKQNDELDKLLLSIKELRESQKETSQQIKEASEQQKETDEQMRETSKKIGFINQKIEGITKSQGLEAEEFFYSSLVKNPQLGNVHFDIVSKQGTKKMGQNEKYQMDIFLENGNSVGIVEVKNKARLDDIEQLESQVERFEKFYTTHKGMKKHGVLAAKIMPEFVEKATLQKGFFVLKQQGDHIEVSSPV